MANTTGLTLLVDVDVMDNKVRDLNNISTIMRELVDNMKTTVDSLANSWESEAGNNYIGKFGVAKTECEDSLDNLNKYIEKLINASEVYRSAEEKVKEKVDALSYGNIF